MARSAHRQDASYLDTLNATAEWNPSDYAHHLTRRARGLPMWFSLAVYGTDAYRDAVERVLEVTRETAEEIRRRPELELVVEPELSVVLFRRARLGARGVRAVVAPGARGPGRVRPAARRGRARRWRACAS